MGHFREGGLGPRRTWTQPVGTSMDFHPRRGMEKRRCTSETELSLTTPVQKLRENRETIQKLTSQLQEMQEQRNSMYDSGEFQEVESNYSGRLSYVSSHPAMIPSSRSMLSRDTRLPLDTWNNSGLQETFFWKLLSTFDPPRDHHQGTQPDDVQRNREAVPEAGRTKTIHTCEDRQSQGTIPMPTFVTRPPTTSSTIPVELPQSFLVGQQRYRNCKSTNSPNPQSLLVSKIRFKTK